MPSEVTKTVLQAGLVADSVVEELGRWGMPIPVVVPGSIAPESVSTALERAMTEEGYVEVKETDLEVLQHYLKTQKSGTLHFELLEGTSENFEISYGLTPFGEYIIPWTDSDISDAMTNGLTYLEIPDACNDAGVVLSTKRVAIHTVRELYYGDIKAFMVCAPE